MTPAPFDAEKAADAVVSHIAFQRREPARKQIAEALRAAEAVGYRRGLEAAAFELETMCFQGCAVQRGKATDHDSDCPAYYAPDIRKLAEEEG